MCVETNVNIYKYNASRVGIYVYIPMYMYIKATCIQNGIRV